MTAFRTILTIPPSNHHINHQSVCWSIGSCFAENIGQRLLDNKFQLSLNPMGIIYNPISIAETLACILNKKQFTKSDLFEHESQWHSFLHHGSFSNADPNQCLTAINTQLEEAGSLLPNLDTVLLTLGTAHCFKYMDSGKVVANCHRLPNQQFERFRLSTKQVIQALQPALEQLKAAAPKVRVLLTVSPVRYLRDGLVESNRSKASLLLAVDTLVEQLDFVSYFPAYELVTDELRDYRFFDTDMAHPSRLAIDYVYDRFQETYMKEQTLQLNRQLSQIKCAMAHRPKNTNQASQIEFKQQQRSKIQEIQNRYPFLDMKDELSHFS